MSTTIPKKIKVFKNWLALKKLDFMVLTFQKIINYYHFDFLISRRVSGPQTKFTMGFPYCIFGDISQKII